MATEKIAEVGALQQRKFAGFERHHRRRAHAIIQGYFTEVFAGSLGREHDPAPVFVRDKDLDPA